MDTRILMIPFAIFSFAAGWSGHEYYAGHSNAAAPYEEQLEANAEVCSSEEKNGYVAYPVVNRDGELRGCLRVRKSYAGSLPQTIFIRKVASDTAQP